MDVGPEYEIFEHADGIQVIQNLDTAIKKENSIPKCAISDYVRHYVVEETNTRPEQFIIVKKEPGFAPVPVLATNSNLGLVANDERVNEPSLSNDEVKQDVENSKQNNVGEVCEEQTDSDDDIALGSRVLTRLKRNASKIVFEPESDTEDDDRVKTKRKQNSIKAQSDSDYEMSYEGKKNRKLISKHFEAKSELNFDNSYKIKKRKSRSKKFEAPSDSDHDTPCKTKNRKSNSKIVETFSDSDYDNVIKIKKKRRSSSESNKSSNEIKSSKRTDLFQQPFVRKVLQNHVDSHNSEEEDDLISEIGYASFVDPKRVCRLCLIGGKTVFIKLFGTNHQPTPIAEKISFLLEKSKVEEDLLPQQICLKCLDSVNASYIFVKQVSRSCDILHGVVDEIKKKTHLFQKDKDTAMCIRIHEDSYEFCPYDPNLDEDKPKRKPSMDHTKSTESIQCHECKQHFTPEALKDHMATEHDTHVEYKCSSCENSYPTLPLLHDHMCPNVNIKPEDKYHTDNDFESDAADYRYDTDSDDNSDTDDDMSEYKPIKRGRAWKIKTVDEQSELIVKSGSQDTRSCKYCNRLFKSTFPENSIKSHIFTHDVNFGDTDDFILENHLLYVPCFVCTFCKMPKRTQPEMRAHLVCYCNTFAKKFQFKMRDRKPRKKITASPLFCQTCNDNKPYIARDYTKHLKENHPDTLIKCFYCPKTFANRRLLLYHNRTTHLHPNREYHQSEVLCEHCSRVFKSLKGYKSHVKTCAKNKDPNFRKKVRSRRKPFSTRKPCVQTNVEKLHCPICNLKSYFKNGQAGLDFHIMKHNSPTGRVLCCNREFKNFVKYSSHLRGHSRQWHCKYCGLFFGSGTLLRDHVCNQRDVMQNEESKIVYCKTCHSTFSNKKELRIHRRTIHWAEDETGKEKVRKLRDPIVCCGSTFYTKVNFKQHQKRHAATPCKTCGDVLSSKTALKKHVEIAHPGLRKECTYCEQTFSNSDALKYHMLKHTQGRMFKCPCGYSFYTEFDLRRHQMIRKEKNTPCIQYYE